MISVVVYYDRSPYNLQVLDTKEDRIVQTSDILPRAVRKKRSGGKNKTPRTPVQIPTQWLELARLRARFTRQPVTWYLIALIEADARTGGITNFPPAPWDHPSASSAEIHPLVP